MSHRTTARLIPGMLGGLVPLLALAMTTIAAGELHAQLPLSPRSLGMGGALMPAARGQEAIFLNPGNLGLSDSPRWSVALAGISAGVELHGIGIDELVDLIDYDDLPSAERDALFAEIPAGGVRGEVDVRAPVAAAQVGRFGFGVAYLTVGGHSLSRDLAELLLYGYEEGRSDYSVRDTRGDRASLWDVAVAYGSATGPVSWGITGHLLLGGTLTRTFMTEPRVDLAARDIEVDYLGVRSSGGAGVAFDLGAAYRLRPDVTISGSVTSAYSRLDWSDDIRVRELSLSRVDFDDGHGLDDFLDRYESSERALTPEDEALLGTSAENYLQSGSQLPTRANLGAAWQPAAGTDLVVTYSEDLTDGDLGGDWTRRAGVGVEQRFWYLAVRAGAATNGDGEHMFTGGLSLGPIDLGAARLAGGEEGDESSGWIGVFGLSMRVP